MYQLALLLYSQHLHNQSLYNTCIFFRMMLPLVYQTVLITNILATTIYRKDPAPVSAHLSYLLYQGTELQIYKTHMGISAAIKCFVLPSNRSVSRLQFSYPVTINENKFCLGSYGLLSQIMDLYLGQKYPKD